MRWYRSHQHLGAACGHGDGSTPPRLPWCGVLAVCPAIEEKKRQLQDTSESTEPYGINLSIRDTLHAHTVYSYTDSWTMWYTAWNLCPNLPQNWSPRSQPLATFSFKYYTIANLQFLKLSLDRVHVFNKRVEVGHVEVHRLEPLKEALVVSEELLPASVESCHCGLLLSEAAGDRVEVQCWKVAIEYQLLHCLIQFNVQLSFCFK